MFEKSGYIVVVFQCQPHILHFYVQRNVSPDGHQLVAQSDVFPRRLELLFLPGCQFIEVGIDVFHAAVFADQSGRPDFPDTLHARNIVGRVTADGQHLDDLQGGTYAVPGAYGTLVQNLGIFPSLAGSVLKDSVIHKLAVVLVRSHHKYFSVRGLHLLCH